MFERLSNGWALAQQSLRVLSLDKELLLFPLISGLACLGIMASFALPLWLSGYLSETWGSDSPWSSLVGYLILFAFYLCTYTVIIFFNAALVSCALIRLKGGNPTLWDGLGAASARIPHIIAWALVAATVGLVLQAIESRSEKVGRFVAGVLGMAWSVMTYFVVPVLVVEKVGPVQAVQRSLAVMKRAWGEALAANFGWGMIVFLLYLAAGLPIILGLWACSAGYSLLGVAGIAFGLLAILVIALVTSAVQSILLAALYLFASEGQTPPQFERGLLEHAFDQKRTGPIGPPGRSI